MHINADREFSVMFIRSRNADSICEVWPNKVSFENGWVLRRRSGSDLVMDAEDHYGERLKNPSCNEDAYSRS